MDYKKSIAELVNIDGVSTEEIFNLIAIPQDESMGDFALPCFRFAKALRMAPAVIAQNLANDLAGRLPACFDSVTAVNGYLNFKISEQGFISDTLAGVLSKGADYGTSNKGVGKTVCIDYSSVNIAKPFHIGHLSTTAIGAALYRIYKALGYNVVGINHLGDWGTQFGKLIVAYKRWGNKDYIEKHSIRALLEIYVKFHDEAESDPTLLEEGRAWFKKIEDGDEEALSIFHWFKDITMREVQKVYERLHVKFDSYAGESFYNDKMDPVLDELKQKGLLVESDGAEVVKLDEYNMPPCLLKKADGATLYATRDIAAAFYRKNTYDFYKCLYVVAYQQNLHFKQWFKVVELMGYDWAKSLEHVAFGMVSLSDGTLSTRHGKVVFLEDVMNACVKRAKEIIEEKNPNTPDADEIAEKVGVGAVIFSAVSNGRIKDIVFSMDRVLNFDGETSPYIQYTHARCMSVLKKAGVNNSTPDFSALDKTAFSLVKLIDRFPTVVEQAGEKYEPSFIARHIIDIAEHYNKFYFDNRIISGGDGAEKARLMLTEATMAVIKAGMTLLGIDCPDKM